MKMGKYLLAALLVLGLAATVSAAPVGLTSEADATRAEMWTDNNLSLNIGIMGDFVSERKIDVDSGDWEMVALIARVGLSVIDRFNFYADIGEASDMEYRYTILGEKHVVAYEDGILWGIGASALIYRWDNGLEIGTNISYRQIDTAMETVTINSTTFKNTDLSKLTDDDYEEFQVAIELGWRTEYFIPYIGVKYSDVELGSDYTSAPTDYAAKGKNSEQCLGLLVGLTITPKIDTMPRSEQLSINVEGRFLDEEAISVGASYKF